MAVRPGPAQEVTDLTGENGEEVLPGLSQPPSICFRGTTNSLSVNGNHANGHANGHTNGHGYASNAPALSFPEGPDPLGFLERPVKRQKTSESTQTFAKFSKAQHVALSTTAILSNCAAAATDSIRDQAVDKVKLKAKVKTLLRQRFESAIRRSEGSLHRALHLEIEATARRLARIFAEVAEFRHHHHGPLTSAPHSAAANAQPAFDSSPTTTSIAPTTSPTTAAPYAKFLSPTNGLHNGEPLADSFRSFAPAKRLPFTTSPTTPLTTSMPTSTPTQSKNTPTRTSVDLARQLEPQSTRLEASQSPASQALRPLRPTRQHISASTKTAAAAAAPTSPANFRSRAKVAAWKSDNDEVPDAEKKSSSYFALERRPYTSWERRSEILSGNRLLYELKPGEFQRPEVFHVDFSVEEARKVQSAVRQALGLPAKKRKLYKELSRVLKLNGPGYIARLADQLRIEGRQPGDIHAFFNDVLQVRALVKEPQVLSIEVDAFDKRSEDLRESRFTSLLFAREIFGHHGISSMRRLEDLKNNLCKVYEDGLELHSEFTNCAGDISTISWVSNSAYVAGTTVHMDSHNQQYNKPGNLVLGSLDGPAMLKSYPDHRILRPIVPNGDNSTDEMRASQDPWLYTSVVSSDHDTHHNRTYTSGFDKVVKIWKIEPSGSSMDCLGEWKHDGIVNFVQASRLKDTELVATAADVPAHAIRIYKVNPGDPSKSPYTSFSASRIQNADGSPLVTDKWVYFPSTMKWGVADSVKQLLLAGFSPRSLTNDENDIPQDRRNTGELCLWDSLNGQAVRIARSYSSNVFEVLWHPEQPVFVAASSPTNNVDAGVRTQVRIFVRSSALDDSLVFGEIKTLDCPAFDINELTMIPNGYSSSYVTAGCTDGKTYVWDTALGDNPIHVLAHGPPIEGLAAGYNEDDTGVKFTAWGMSPDRFYTGSSDGVVKVWNVRSLKAKGRVILEAPAQISYGAFSPDLSKLVIGDASGRVFLLSMSENARPGSFVNLPGTRRRRPTPVTPHLEPPPPDEILRQRQARTGRALGRAYLASRQLRYSGDHTVGMVQDVNYHQTGFFRLDAHAEYDRTKALMAYVENLQQSQHKMYSNSSQIKRVKKLDWPGGDMSQNRSLSSSTRLMKQHEKNCELDLELEKANVDIRKALDQDGVERRELQEIIHDLEPVFEYVDDVEEALNKGVVVASNEEAQDDLGY